MNTWARILWLPALLVVAQAHGASLFDWLGLGKKQVDTPPALAAALSQGDIEAGLKEALSSGVTKAVAMLGKPDGFLKDVSVKIPMPDTLKQVERTLRSLGQDQLADQFITSMNRAAEQAVPQAALVLGDAVKQMTVADAKAILTGTNNAATQFFRRTTETNLYERFLPIVQKTTEETGVTRYYKQLTEKASFRGFSLGSLLGQENVNLDGYVTRKALDGLFLKIGEQEKLIRENPVARTTDLLQKVFGAVTSPTGTAPR